MAKKFKLPDIGENIESVEIAKILVDEGDEIKEGQTIMELEADKAMVELPSGASGKIKELLVSKGDKVSVGDQLFSYE